MNQAYSRLSTTHGHITDCKFDSVVYAGVGVPGNLRKARNKDRRKLERQTVSDAWKGYIRMRRRKKKKELIET